MKGKDWDQRDAMSEAGQAMLAAIAGVTAAARLRMGRELLSRVEAVDLSALVRIIVVVGATTLWLTSWASGSVPVLMDQRSTPHAVTPSAGAGQSGLAALAQPGLHRGAPDRPLDESARG